MATVSRVWPNGRQLKRSRTATALASVAISIAAVVASVAVALANVPYFDLLNGLVGARETVARGLVFSSWLLLVGAAVVIWRPAEFGFRVGDTVKQWRLVTAAIAGGAAVTALVLQVFGTTPYSDASLFVETVVVPFTEELVFRAVLLTALVAAFAWLHPPRRAALLALVVNGIAFGIAHIGNAGSMDLAFVLPQVTFAMAVGMACAGLMLRTHSVYPAMFLHAAVNAVVVLI